MSSLQKKWTALLHKISYLRFELDDMQEKIEVYEKELTKKFNNVASDDDHRERAKEQEKNINDQMQQKADSSNGEENLVDSSNTDSASLNESFKKVWKQIALKTHPDIAGNKPEIVEKYKQALEAWNAGKLEVILDIAAELSIAIPDPTDGMIKTLEERADKIQDEIKKIESNTLWAWGNAEEAKKEVIVNEILKFRRKRYQTSVD